MKQLLLAFALLSASTSAYAAKTSFLCRTLDTKEYVDVVSTGENTALVQVNGGDFLEAVAEFEDPILFITVPLDTGVLVLAYDVIQDKAALVVKTKKRNQTHEMKCTFRE